MSISFSRVFARTAVFCLVAATSLGTVFVSRAAAGTSSPAEEAPKATARTTDLTGAKADGASRGHYSSSPVRLRSEGRDLLAYPPAASAASHPMTVVYLHGIHGRPENGCPWFRDGASELGWLVCPEGAKHEETGTASWGGDVFEQGTVVARAMRAARANGASSEPGVAVGFSQGGYVALDLVKTRQARFRGLVLIAAPEAHPSAQKLREAGVVRVALAAGSADAAHAPLIEDTKRLQREGIEARFFNLGRVGHTYAAEDGATLREAITWAGGIRE
ncbi:MAG: hypothetical protein BGO98_30960 [Myxococcales bacterium 68-20]|nr:MAG: hypothetical protein BGO98_30960 [Myxococcales bacterium 68-20]